MSNEKEKTNPYQVIIDMSLEYDMLSQESCVDLMKEFGKREKASLETQLREYRRICERFVWKVENGKARSKETYGDMKKALKEEVQ